MNFLGGHFLGFLDLLDEVRQQLARLVDLGVGIGRHGHRQAEFLDPLGNALIGGGIEEQRLGEGFLLARFVADDVDLLVGTVALRRHVGQRRFERGRHLILLDLDRPELFALAAHRVTQRQYGGDL
ncbi:hypothetical protein D3C72_2080240 [compost metagenome]